MTATPSRADRWYERAPFAGSVALLVWVALQKFVPAHPVEQPTSVLLLAAAMVCGTGAPLLRAPLPRRLVIGASVILVAATFRWL